ncbi:MAG: hypothetical protein U0Q16_20540 [Bryobacteraceae bacterium]
MRAKYHSLLLLASFAAFSGQRSARYAVILEDLPLAAFESASDSKARTANADHAQKLAAAHLSLRTAIADRGIRLLGESQLLLNAVYVATTEDQAERLRALPGVARVVEMPPLKRQMIRAVDLVRVPDAWRTLGGENNAGQGVKIAILDTGIDHRHPAFQASLAVPSGFPRCRAADCIHEQQGDRRARMWTCSNSAIPPKTRARMAARRVTGSAAARLRPWSRPVGTRAPWDDLGCRARRADRQLQDLRGRLS